MDSLAVQALSVGYCLGLAGKHIGRVHSAFRHAVNLQMGDTLWTLLAGSKSDLPFGIRVALHELESLSARICEPVTFEAGQLAIGDHCMVDCRTATPWMPVGNTVCAPGLQARLNVLEAAARDVWWSGSVAIAASVAGVLRNPERLAGVLPKAVGCGPGATPAGDDVLVGILAVLNQPLAGIEGRKLGASLRELLLPLLPGTTDLSGHLLRQAADGHIGRDVHDLIAAMTGTTAPNALNDALRRVLATGASSGADTCAGIIAAAPLLLTPQNESIAA